MPDPDMHLLNASQAKTLVTSGVTGLYEIRPEEVEALANETVRIAEKLDNDFKEADISPVDLVGFEVGETLAESHTMAHSVVMGTFNGVRTDLQGFSESLLLAVKDAQDADSLSQTQLAQIGDIEYTGYYTSQAREDAQNANLTVDENGNVVHRDDV